MLPTNHDYDNYVLEQQTEEQEKNMNLWIESLESGSYSQTRECLRNKEGYCCFGVLIEVVDHPAWISSKVSMQGEIVDCVSQHGIEVWSMPTISWMEEKLGFTLSSSLAALNDAGAPFVLIADLLRHMKIPVNYYISSYIENWKELNGY